MPLEVEKMQVERRAEQGHKGRELIARANSPVQEEQGWFVHVGTRQVLKGLAVLRLR
jgi:hypothetical protein